MRVLPTVSRTSNEIWSKAISELLMTICAVPSPETSRVFDSNAPISNPLAGTRSRGAGAREQAGARVSATRAAIGNHRFISLIYSSGTTRRQLEVVGLISQLQRDEQPTAALG